MALKWYGDAHEQIKNSGMENALPAILLLPPLYKTSIKAELDDAKTTLWYASKLKNTQQRNQNFNESTGVQNPRRPIITIQL